MKFILLLLLTLSSLNIYSQQNYDVRKTIWGMTLKEVKESENSLTADYESENTIIYKNILIESVMSGYGDINTTVIYNFRNGRLDAVNYIFYGPFGEEVRRTCTKYIPLTFRYNVLKPIIISINISKKLKYMLGSIGWRVNYPYMNISEELKNGKFDAETIKLLDKQVSIIGFKTAEINYENERSYVTFEFNTETRQNFECSDEHHNRYMEVKFRPSYVIKKELDQFKF